MTAYIHKEANTEDQLEQACALLLCVTYHVLLYEDKQIAV